jgi:hypothetical protein
LSLSKTDFLVGTKCSVFFLCEKCKQQFISPLKACSGHEDHESSLRTKMVVCGKCQSKTQSKAPLGSLSVAFVKKHYGEILDTVEEVLGKQVVFDIEGQWSVGSDTTDFSALVYPMWVFSRDAMRLDKVSAVDLDEEEVVKMSSEQIDAFWGRSSGLRDFIEVMLQQHQDGCVDEDDDEEESDDDSDDDSSTAQDH